VRRLHLRVLDHSRDQFEAVFNQHRFGLADTAHPTSLRQRLDRHCPL
jgi:hypothetical protein